MAVMSVLVLKKIDKDTDMSFDEIIEDVKLLHTDCGNPNRTIKKGASREGIWRD